MVRVLLIFLILLINQEVHAQLPLLHIVKNENVPEGYVMFTAIDIKQKEKESSVFVLLNTNGELVYWKRMEGRKHFQPFGPSKLAFWNGEKFLIYNSQFELIDSIFCSDGYKTDLHELIWLPGNHYILLGTELVERDLSNYPVFMQKNIRGSKNGKLECNVIQEFDENKKKVFEWHSHDQFDFEDVDPFFLNDTMYVGWTHMNSIEAIGEEHLLLSLKFFNQLIVLNKKNKKVEIRIGGKNATIGWPTNLKPFLAQHDARWHEKNLISTFDNGHAEPGKKHPSRGLIFRWNSITKEIELVKEIYPEKDIHVTRAGSFTLLDNDYYLLGYGQPENHIRVLEIFNSGNKSVFELSMPDTLNTYRTYFLHHSPLSFRTPNFKVKKISGDIYLKALSKKGILWNNGSKEKLIKVEKHHAYQFFEEDGDGGYIGSKKYYAE